MDRAAARRLRRQWRSFERRHGPGPRRATRRELVDAWLVVGAVLVVAGNLIVGMVHVFAGEPWRAAVSAGTALILAAVVGRRDG